MDYQNNLIKVDMRNNGVCVVSLDNPPLNVVSLPVIDELYDVMAKLPREETVKAVIVTGGARTFSAGSDVKEFPGVRDCVVDKKLKKENEAFNGIEFLPQPTIAAMEGNTCGGGLEIAMACDIRVMSDKGRLGMPEINLGIFPASGGLFRLPKLVGMAKAMELMYLGEFISAEECLRIGLVNRLAPAGATLEAALAMAGKIAAKPVEPLRRIKKGVRAFQHKDSEQTFWDNLRLSADLWDAPDCREGVSAFLEKRAPTFGRPGER